MPKAGGTGTRSSVRAAEKAALEAEQAAAVVPRFPFALFVVRRTCAPRLGGAAESPSAPAEASERSPYVGAPLI